MAKFNTTAANSAVRTLETSAGKANAAWDDTQAKREKAITAIRDYNNSLELTRDAFAVAVKDAEHLRNAGSDLASIVATLPDPIPEPPVGPLQSDGDGNELMTVRGRRLT